MKLFPVAGALRAAAFALVLAIPAAASAQQAGRTDPFATACMAGGKRSASNCACQSKLARANLNAREQRAALAAMRGDRDGLGRELKAMGQNGAKAFDAKMGRLSARSKQTCK